MNKTHKNKNEIFLFVKNFDERTRNFFSKNSINLENRQSRNIGTISNNRYKLNKIIFRFFKITEITELKDELNKTTKLRILSQINEGLTNLFKYRKVLFLTKNFNFHSKKNRNDSSFRFFDEKFNDSLEKKRNRNRKNFIVDDLKNFSSKKTFTFFDDYFSQKKYQ